MNFIWNIETELEETKAILGVSSCSVDLSYSVNSFGFSSQRQGSWNCNCKKRQNSWLFPTHYIYQTTKTTILIVHYNNFFNFVSLTDWKLTKRPESTINQHVDLLWSSFGTCNQNWHCDWDSISYCELFPNTTLLFSYQILIKIFTLQPKFLYLKTILIIMLVISLDNHLVYMNPSVAVHEFEEAYQKLQ